MMFLEHAPHGFQKEFSRQVHHRAIFRIEALVRRRARLVTVQHGLLLRLVRIDMAVEIHAHEDA